MDDLRLDLAKKYHANILQKKKDLNQLPLNPSNTLPRTVVVHTLDNISKEKFVQSTDLLCNSTKEQKLVQEIKKKLLNASFLETENLKLLQENKKLLQKNKKLNLQLASSQDILNEIKEAKKSISSQNLTISLIRVDLTKIQNRLHMYL